METPTANFTICYNLVPNTTLAIPLPNAYLVANQGQELGYIEKQALVEVLDSYQIDYKDTTHEQLLEICQLLKPESLARKFKPKRKKIATLEDIVSDKQLKTVMMNYVDRKLTTFYDLLAIEGYPVCYNAQRREPIPNSRITRVSQLLDPLLSFQKAPEAIHYQLQLGIDNTVFNPWEHTITLLQDQPAQILIDRKWYTVKHINAKKLTPFLDKKTVVIPAKNTKLYFEKFIGPILKKVNVHAEGFTIDIHNTIQNYELELYYDFFLKKVACHIQFNYEGTLFSSAETRKTATEIQYLPQQDIALQQIKRNPDKESEILQNITQLGLVNESGKLYLENHHDDAYALVTWLAKNANAIQKLGFSIALTQLDQKKISLSAPEIQLDTQMQNDWFDLKGTIAIGDFSIPFTHFIPFIKKGERFFLLPDETHFIIPSSWMTTYQQLAQFATVTDESIRVRKSNFKVLEGITTNKTTNTIVEESPDYVPSPKLQATLRPYQQQGVQWLVDLYYKQLGGCLADDMGLGKTLQTIAFLTYVKEQLQPETAATPVTLDLFSTPLERKTYLRALLVMPSSLIFNWYQELQKFAPHLTIANYTGSDRKQLTPYLNTYDLVLTTYHTALRDIEQLQKVHFRCFVADESQQLKNKDSKVFKALHSLAIPHKISLSGTPIENSLSDLWSQMQFINPEILGSYPFFKKYFQLPIEKHQNVERTQELKTLVAPFILRRTKEQVAKELPKLSEQIIYTEMLPEQEKRYEAQKSAARNQLLKIGENGISLSKINVINTLTKLRQLSNHPQLLDAKATIPSGKFQDVTEYLQTLLRAQKKVLIFSSFVQHLECYTQWCDALTIPYCLLTGQTNVADRAKAVADFQENPDIPFFFISIKAGGTGLNLTSASYVVLLDPWWNPFVEQQAIARAHRIGQTNPVTVTKFITKNTVEEKIVQLQERKKLLSDEIIAVDAIPELDQNTLQELLK